ncbi:hypothetical protein M758_UG150500 [Ceratodon purpureus]|nr:hypothetical protein M758_UG150500 [Ceratodon purpureus]
MYGRRRLWTSMTAQISNSGNYICVLFFSPRICSASLTEQRRRRQPRTKQHGRSVTRLQPLQFLTPSTSIIDRRSSTATRLRRCGSSFPLIINNTLRSVPSLFKRNSTAVSYPSLSLLLVSLATFSNLHGG